jgi:hypothetical protein
MPVARFPGQQLIEVAVVVALVQWEEMLLVLA